MQYRDCFVRLKGAKGSYAHFVANPLCAMAQVDDALVRRATSFMFNLMKTDLDVFFEAHCHHFEVGEEEHKLVYTKLYKEFEKIVDYKMNDFVRDEGYSSSRALYKDILESVEHSPRSTLYLNVFLAAADYEKFVKLMQHRSSRRREEAKLDEDNDAYEGDASGGDESECSSNAGSGGGYWSSRYGGKQADPGAQENGLSMAEGGSWKK